jgi:hypothetical protein
LSDLNDPQLAFEPRTLCEKESVFLKVTSSPRWTLRIVGVKQKSTIRTR